MTVVAQTVIDITPEIAESIKESYSAVIDGHLAEIKKEILKSADETLEKIIREFPRPEAEAQE